MFKYWGTIRVARMNSAVADCVAVKSDPRPLLALTKHTALFALQLTVQFNLFGGTLYRLGTEKHRHLLKRVDDLSQVSYLVTRSDMACVSVCVCLGCSFSLCFQVGCFALTELGFGNNAVSNNTDSLAHPSSVYLQIGVFKEKIKNF